MKGFRSFSGFLLEVENGLRLAAASLVDANGFRLAAASLPVANGLMLEDTWTWKQQKIME